MKYDDLFKKAAGWSPYPYQTAFAAAESLPKVLNVPTGVGKTATVVLGWLYRRTHAADEVKNATPRRLVYCLPMRTLVEQTKEAACGWLDKLALADEVGVHLLMGGTDVGDWDGHPEKDAILIGTQDMLLSRALNRGYGMSRYRWPMHYALLNNDCLWVLDETQLMGVGLTTSVQLAGFRDKLPVFGVAHTLWMSATLDHDALTTVDHPADCIGETDVLRLDEEDRSDVRVDRLLTAKKPLQKCCVSLTAENSKSYPQELAGVVVNSVKNAPQSSLTLVIINRVSRAQAVYQELKNLFSKSESESPEVHLIHSRYRKEDRDRTQKKALNEENIPAAGRIVVATQAIEAGVDISAATLFTELAPWSSLVQRFGRCNRRGTCDDARVFWIGIETEEGKTSHDCVIPYSVDELTAAREHLEALQDVGPQSLGQVQHSEQRPIVHTLRRKDLLELWDTTPDLAGNDLDVSRYIRDSDDTDVQVYWREWENDKSQPPPKAKERDGEKRLKFPAPTRKELCAVSIVQFKKFLKQDTRAFRWNPTDEQWDKVTQNNVRPGNIVLLHCVAGGYQTDLGWTGEAKSGRVEPIPLDENYDVPNDAYNTDDEGNKEENLTEHLQNVAGKAENIAGFAKQLIGSHAISAVKLAALWHDVGKAHDAFQNAMHSSRNGELSAAVIWAKSGGKGRLRYFVEESGGIDKDGNEKTSKIIRPGFRHELASALVWLAHADGQDDADLIAYLIAAHHGKVRGNIRSLPIEKTPSDPQKHFARGIWDGDRIPAVDLGNGQQTPEVVVDLSLMELGEYIDQQGRRRPSWRARVAGLLETFGPFRLAYLETLVRIADWRGSKNGGAL